MFTIRNIFLFFFTEWISRLENCTDVKGDNFEGFKFTITCMLVSHSAPCRAPVTKLNETLRNSAFVVSECVSTR